MAAQNVILIPQMWEKDVLLFAARSCLMVGRPDPGDAHPESKIEDPKWIDSARMH